MNIIYYILYIIYYILYIINNILHPRHCMAWHGLLLLLMMHALQPPQLPDT